MKLVIGLGNPGNQYNFTRHNFGFLALDFFAKIQGWEWEKKPKFNAIWAKHNDTIYIKPQTFYNEVGRCVQYFMHYYKIPVEDILVICDDFDMEFGKIRFREKGSHGGNNGLRSIIKELGTSDFARLKLGTGNKELRTKMDNDTDFVLGRFTTEEKEQLPGILSKIKGHLSNW